ncbi:MAG: hypothetical protein CMG64_00355 [Candidatus Marinimicrobia bacterium]|nr:hypothetical protein [Candidatus Neomarinimicrobiota bacterium]|tara:strand:- start:15628 stop:15855 length:228 start_codon:yes stop_codon:yes gene_type:complete
MFRSIKKILKDKNFQNEEYLMFEKIKKEWKKINNTLTNKNVKVYDYTNQELVLKTTSSEWRSEITTQKEEIKKNF